MVLLSVMAVQVALAGDKIIVMGHNVENFFYSTDRTLTAEGNPNTLVYYTDEEGRQRKMDAMANAYFPADSSVKAADIYCFNEVECCEEILDYIASNFREKSGRNYQYVTDGLTYDKDYYYNGVIKSGYVYNADRVRPFGANTATGSGFHYVRRMRMQTFEEIATGERFTIAMNHFKAGNVEDNGATRVANAESLLSALPDANDPDILIMGDLNSEVGEACLTMIQDAGYEEQLLRFEPTAWSYVYQQQKELIDHAFANESMAEQVTGAKMLHIANYSSLGWNYFSDHDAYMLEVELTHPDVPTYTFAKATEVKAGGQYLIVAPIGGSLQAAMPVPAGDAYGYMLTQPVSDIDGVITLDDMNSVFTLEDAGNGMYYIKDSNDRYFHQTQRSGGGWYTSVAMTDDVGTAYRFTVSKENDGTFRLLSETGYYLFGKLYNSSPEFLYGNYSSLSNGNYLPWLYEFTTVPTAITTFADSQQPIANGIYDLQGRRVDGSRFKIQGSGLKPGLYIVNGKKVVIK